MRPDGVEVLARWREAGAWWEGEAPQEVVQYRDARGVKRERRRALPSPHPTPPTAIAPIDPRDDYALRPRKLRDEKVSLACGLVNEAPAPGYRARTSATYAPMHVLSGYSFGRSTLFAREVPRRAAEMGMPAAALVDRFALTGAMEFAREARDCGVKPLIGSTLEMAEGGEVVLIARDKRGYAELSQLVSACHLEEPRRYPLATRERLARHTRGLLCLTGGDAGKLNRLLLAREFEAAEEWLDMLIGLYGRANVFVEIERSHLPWGISVEYRLAELAARRGLTCVAGGAVTHAEPGDFPAQDVLVCADTLCLVEEVIGRRPLRDVAQPVVPACPVRSLNAERYLAPVDEMVKRFADRPDLLAATLDVVERCDADVLPGRTRLPPLSDDPERMLVDLTYQGARERHGALTKQLESRLEHELERINRLGFAPHFLTAWDVCRWARDQRLLFSGRGSVVDSAVAYCLGMSRIDAHAHRLHFDRFLPDDGSKRPDIDLDFESRRRDDVRNYMIARYGRERVATVSAIGAYCTRGIIREVGKALGLPNEAIGFLAKRIHGGVSPDRIESALEKRPELRASGISRERFAWVIRLAKMLMDVPRNMRAHSSGVVISDRPLAETVPVQWSGGEQDDGESAEHLRIIQWDKRSAKHCFDKFDILCLRGQDVLAGTQERLVAAGSPVDVESLGTADEETYRAMRSGELIGIPQSASPAMRQAHMRLQTTDLHDASLVQAGIRPGVGGAVKINELIARRRGTKPYVFEHPDLEKILACSYGIVVFQEQIDQLLQVFGGYSGGEAEEIREEIHKRRREDYGQVIRDEVLARIVARGYSGEIAQHVFELVAGFKGYGFAQGHALAFAEISIRSIACQQNFPAEYFASLLDAQPAGYYGPCTLVNEARSRGVVILPPDVQRSGVQFETEDVRTEDTPPLVVPDGGIRVALSAVSGLSRATRERIVDARRDGYTDFFDFVRRARPERDELEQLVLAGACDRFHPNRRALLWAVPSALREAEGGEGGLGVTVPSPELRVDVPDFTPAERAVRERAVLGLDVEHHLMAFERERVTAKGAITTYDARRLKPGTRAVVVGNPIRLRFPPTPTGRRVVFFDLEDETGLLNVTCFDDVYQRDGHAIVCSPYVTLIGRSQWRDGCTAFLASRVFAYQPMIARLADLEEGLPVTSADFLSR